MVMKQLLRIVLLIGLAVSGIGWLTTVQAQTITTGAVSTTGICVGTAVAVSVPFTTGGTFGAGTVFTAQLSNASGSFASPVPIGTLTANPASTTTLSISGTIPATTPAGTGFQVRVVSATPASGTVTSSAVIGTVGATVLTASQPAAPVVTAGLGPYCQGATAAALVASGQNLKYYNSAGVAIAGVPVVSTTAPGTQTFGVTQTVNGCESPKTAINIVVNATPAAPTVTSPVNLCLSATAQPLTATPTAGNTLRWYGTSSTGGTASATAPTPSNQTSGSYYVW
jgi:hypothetical protein